MKTCTKCLENKSYAAFYRDKCKKDGYTSWCKGCHAAYYQNNKQRYAEYREHNRDELNRRTKDVRLRNMNEWDDYFRVLYGPDPACMSCGNALTWDRGERQKTVHFDHRHGGVEVIDITPTKFCEKKPCTQANQDIWQSCDFGILCFRCNSILPTENREEWLRRVNQYVFGPCFLLQPSKQIDINTLPRGDGIATQEIKS